LTISVLGLVNALGMLEITVWVVQRQSRLRRIRRRDLIPPGAHDLKIWGVEGWFRGRNIPRNGDPNILSRYSRSLHGPVHAANASWFIFSSATSHIR
jgi:hypothetical protein